MALARLDGILERGSIGAQVGRVFNLFALLVLVLGTLATIGALRFEQRSNTLADFNTVAFLTASMDRTVNVAKGQMGAYHSRGRETEMMTSAVANVESAIAMNAELALATAELGQTYASQVGELNTDLEQFAVMLGEIQSASDELVDQESFLGPKYDAIDVTLDKIAEIREQAAQEVQTYSGDGLYEIQIIIAVLVAGVLLALGLVFLGKRIVAKQIVAPIAAISDASERIAAGETELDIPAKERTDEIGTLSAALTVLREVQSEVHVQAQLDLEKELQREREVKEERERQDKAQRAMIHSIADSLEQTVGDVANEVAAASGQMHSAASALAENVEGSSKTVVGASESLKQASEGITGAASATDEFAMSIAEVSSQATSSSERARKASEAAAKADVTIAGLTQAADKISQIVEVIAGIAQRTNLLALNASIEAARGGEAGRGFAVVASEVKELATQTGKATEEVEGLIREMQNSTGESASALALISSEVIELETTATAIASAVDQQAVAGQGLARSIDMAARNTQMISATIDDVSKVSLAAGSTASQMLDSSAAMSNQSERLRTQVAEFLEQVREA